PPEQTKNKLRRNQYGGVASGPIIRNKTFWLFNWEARRESPATPAGGSLPAPGMRAGGLSEILQRGNPRCPSNSHPAPTRAIRAPGSAAPFPNNIIPASLIPQASKNLLTWKETSPFAQGGFIAYPNVDAQARAINSPINLAGTINDIITSNQFLSR